MSKERGVSSLVTVAIIGIATLMIGIFSYYLFSSKTSIDTQRKAAADKEAADAPAEIAADSPATQSLISYDSFVYASPIGMYYRTSTPVTSEGGTTAKAGKYLLIEGADPATFSEIKKLPVKNPTNTDAGAKTVVTYYHDSDEVFVAQTTTDSSGDTDSTVSVVTADPATFQILNDTYAKDANHVYAVSWICEGETCTLVLVIVVGADPATFHVIEETIVQQSDGTGVVTADAVDATHLFNNGVIVDTVITPGSNETDMTPVLISP